MQVSDGVQEFGTTSACAENTLSEILRIHSLRNYLRVRGEYMFRNFTQPSGVELPPRARRIPSGNLATTPLTGTTSACAENTWLGVGVTCPSRNYLRVRGEYRIWRMMLMLLRELPPRARRILNAIQSLQQVIGTTSACAENTDPLSTTEDLTKELPPRARRIQAVKAATGADYGTTSACAENTFGTGRPEIPTRNYLRVRGEYSATFAKTGTEGELPPRARRIRVWGKNLLMPLGTTSACAENTRVWLSR